MSATNAKNAGKVTNPLHQNYLDYLYVFLDLALRTGSTASKEDNHKVVLQAAREAGRLISLMHKIAPEADSALDELSDPLESCHSVWNLKTASDCGNGKHNTPWEKSGKLAGNFVSHRKKSKENKKHMVNEKIFQKTGASREDGKWLKDLDAGRLDIATLSAIGAGRPLPEVLPEFLAAIQPGAVS
jgi:hypothetical protein